MNCLGFRELANEFLDHHLDAKGAARMRDHLAQCVECSRFLSELELIQSFVSERFVLTEFSSKALAQRLREDIGGHPFRRARMLAERLSTYFRDLDVRLFWTRLAGTPIALTLILVLMFLLVPAKTQRLLFLVVLTPDAELGQQAHILNVEVAQSKAEFDRLMATAWRLPYEDSLSVVAEIEPEGYATIGNVLEYPKSYALLSAVNTALRGTNFQKVSERPKAFLIFSFQKIDVYENNMGL